MSEQPIPYVCPEDVPRGTFICRTNGLPAAIENAAKLTAEIIETLRGNKELEK